MKGFAPLPSEASVEGSPVHAHMLALLRSMGKSELLRIAGNEGIEVDARLAADRIALRIAHARMVRDVVGRKRP